MRNMGHRILSFTAPSFVVSGAGKATLGLEECRQVGVALISYACDREKWSCDHVNTVGLHPIASN